jgi:hypothetical protein
MASLSVDKRRKILGVILQADVGIGRCRAAVASQIDGDHTIVPRELANLRLPNRMVQGDAVNEEKRRWRRNCYALFRLRRRQPPSTVRAFPNDERSIFQVISGLALSRTLSWRSPDQPHSFILQPRYTL